MSLRKSDEADKIGDRKRSSSSSDQQTADGDGKNKTKAEKIQFKLTLGLKEAHDLTAMDKCGTSDPYVKVKIDSQTVYRTKTIMRELDPVWNETCELILDHLGQKVYLNLYDYDRGSISDDFLGRVDIDILSLPLDKSVQHKLELLDKGTAVNNGKVAYRGYIIITTHLQRLGPADKEKQDKDSKSSKPDFVRRLTFNNQTWRHSLEVVVASIRDIVIPLYSSSLSPMSNFTIRVSYGSDSNRTKPTPFPVDKSANTTIPIGEQFFYVIKDEVVNELVVELCQGDTGNNVLGRFTVAVANLSIEQTHKIESRLSSNSGSVLMTVTLTGTRPDVIAAAGCLPSPTWTPFGPPMLSSQWLQAEETTWMKELAEIFSLQRSKQLPGDVTGVLILKVLQAKNLMPSDIGGKSDPFCVVEIINARVRTYTEYKTLHPRWNRTFIIPVNDIHAFMTLTIFDDDLNGKPDFLGKIVIPLLRIHETNGERHWHVLRTSRLGESAVPRGSIEVEGHLFYNKPRAIMRALDPKEQSYLGKEEKVSIKLLQKDIQKIRKLIDKFYKVINFFQDLIAWTNPVRTITAIMIWTVMCLMADVWMAPFGLALVFGFTKTTAKHQSSGPYEELPAEEPSKEEPPADDSKFSLTDKLNKLNEICLGVHRLIDTVTSFYERLKNIILWRSPWVSAAAASILLLLAFLMFIIPPRLLIMALGIYELVKKKVRPNAGFEAYDLISRAYTDNEMVKFREPSSSSKHK